MTNFVANIIDGGIIMCQTALISQNIVRLGARSYRHRLEALSPTTYRVETPRRLNRDLDDFYEFLYSQYNTVTETDYKVFGEQLVAMLKTLRLLYTSCSRIPKKSGVSTEVEKLKMNYSALYELNEDIRKFRIKTKKDSEWSLILCDASDALQKISHD